MPIDSIDIDRIESDSNACAPDKSRKDRSDASAEVDERYLDRDRYLDRGSCLRALESNWDCLLKWASLFVVNSIIAFIIYESARNLKSDDASVSRWQSLLPHNWVEAKSKMTNIANETSMSSSSSSSSSDEEHWAFAKTMRYPITFPKLNIGKDVIESNLSCPHQALVYGLDFAVTSQRYRMLTLFEDTDVCRRIYFTIGMNDNILHYIDGPGSSFSSRMWSSVPMRDYGNMIHLTGYPLLTKMG